MNIENLKQDLLDLAHKNKLGISYPNCDTMLKLGFEHIGNGCFAHVFVSNCGKYILRISHKADDAQPFFAQLAIEHAENPFFPKIHWHVHTLNKKMHITLMEPLKPASFCLKTAPNTFKYALNYISISKPLVKFWSKLKVCFNKDLKQSVKAINALKKSHNLSDDISTDNVMLREEQLVFTDPLC